MDKRLQQNLLVTGFGVTLFVALLHLSNVLSFLKGVVRIILPVIAGGIVALFINVPMKGIEKQLQYFFAGKKKAPSKKMIHILSFVGTMLAVVLVLVAVLTLLIPELVRSSQNLYYQIKADLPNWIEYLNSHDLNIAWLEKFMEDINIDKILQGISNSVDTLIVNVAGALSSTVNVLVTGAFSAIVAVYIVLGKERLCRHTRKLIDAYVKKSWADRFFHFCSCFSQTFSKFLSGQCTEAIILGSLMFLAFSVFRLPYGSLVGVLTAVCAIIPYVGAFISSGVSVILTLVVDPTLVLRCLIVYSAVQFVENQFIYPRVVGSSVGLPPFYALIAAMIGGKLFGIIGIIFFIPLAAVMLELVKEDAAYRIEKKKAVTVQEVPSNE